VAGDHPVDENQDKPFFFASFVGQQPISKHFIG